jgi:hypothetical protein
MRQAPFDCHRRLPSQLGHRVGKPVASDRQITYVEASGGADLSCLAAQASPDSLSRPQPASARRPRARGSPPRAPPRAPAHGVGPPPARPPPPRSPPPRRADPRRKPPRQ